jgi:hypothetical protein
MFDLFGAPWSSLAVEDVEAFLREADQEGVTWEAKADTEQSSLRPRPIRKAACGFANQIGGYLILGARKTAGEGWDLPGITPPAHEPEVWIGQILRGLQPEPRFAMKSWPRGKGKVAIVVQIEPVAVPPCMTPEGRVYERVTGETLPVEDPILLDKLFRRGKDARARAAQLAPRAATRALDASGWFFQKSVGLAVGLAPLARETDDISSRLFIQETRNAIAEANWDLLSGLRPEGRPDDVGHLQEQDAYAALFHFNEQRTWGVNDEVVATNRSTWLTQANWDGSVAASLTLSDGNVAQAPPPEVMIAALWRVIVPLCRRLGGYGPSQLSVVIAVTKTWNSRVIGQAAHAPGRPPPSDSFYSQLEETTQADRAVDLTDPDDEVVASLGREIRRAAGEIQDED